MELEKNVQNENDEALRIGDVSGSALIADFLGWEKSQKLNTYRVPNLYPIFNINDEENTGWIEEKVSKLEFHTRWDWVMPVVEKISKTKIGDGIKTVDYAYPRTFGMINDETGNLMVRFNSFQVFESEKLIDATYLAVVDFLKWYFSKK